ncbi:hypothetical protein BHE74_00019775 [Ensete ventricosum]|nr:hypothetical protein BHE74_00019775 [Ensete ventricosum]
MATGEIDEAGIHLVPLVGEMLRVNAALPEPEVAASVPKQGLQGGEAPFASAKGVVVVNRHVRSRWGPLARSLSLSLCSPPPEKTLSSALESDKDPRRALLLRSDLVAHLVPSVILVPLGGGRNRTVLRSRDREEKLILAAPEAASYWIRYPIGKRMEDCFAAVFEIPNLANGRRTGGPTQEEHARPEIPCPGKLDSLLAADELYSYSWHKS